MSNTQLASKIDLFLLHNTALSVQNKLYFLMEALSPKNDQYGVELSNLGTTGLSCIIDSILLDQIQLTDDLNELSTREVK